MSQSLVGVFDRREDAQAVAQELIGMGIQQTHVRISDDSAAAAPAAGATREKGFWESVKDLFSSGDDDGDNDRYGLREAARRGSTILTVTTEDANVERVTEVMRRHNVVNLDERARQWGTQGWTGYQQYQAADVRAPAAETGTAAASELREAGTEKIPVVQEELRVGKRAVSRGGVRVVSRVTEQPVEEQVNLREERVHVERRPTDRPLTPADTGAFRERTIEATERAEEAVVAKNARVVEEVVVSKDATQRTETVRDTVRRTDVDVQRTEGDAQFRPAYQFADELTADARYRGRSFDEVETEIRSSYEQRNPDSRWDDVRDAVRSRFGKTRTNT